MTPFDQVSRPCIHRTHAHECRHEQTKKEALALEPYTRLCVTSSSVYIAAGRATDWHFAVVDGFAVVDCLAVMDCFAAVDGFTVCCMLCGVLPAVPRWGKGKTVDCCLRVCVQSHSWAFRKAGGATANLRHCWHGGNIHIVPDCWATI